VPRGSAAAGAAVPGKKGSKAWAWAAGIITVLVIAGIVLAIVLTAGGGEGEMVTVPNLVGLSEDEARDSLESVGLKLQKEDDYITSESKQVGVVSSQDPAAGTSLEEGKSVTAKVTAELRMPNVIGQTPSEAEAALKKQGISMIVVSNTPVTDAGEVGKVVSQDPAGGSLISKDTKVTLEVGEESKTVAVPDVVGLVQAEAETTIENAGLKVTVQEKEDATVPAGQVLSQDPASGKQVDKGSTVTIVVSKPPT
jgi:eukaryotic-like serine/threonine-protein kinase